MVSAMAGETDRLVQLCKEAAALADPQEYDVVVASGEQVTSGPACDDPAGDGRQGAQLHGLAAAVRASGVHGNARVENIDGALLERS